MVAEQNDYIGGNIVAQKQVSTTSNITNTIAHLNVFTDNAEYSICPHGAVFPARRSGLYKGHDLTSLLLS